MSKYYLVPEIVIFNGVKKYVIYIPLHMCQKFDTSLSDDQIKNQLWIFMGIHNNEYYYYMDEGCIFYMNKYLKVRGGGRITYIIVTLDKITNPIIYPIRSYFKHLPFIKKDIE